MFLHYFPGYLTFILISCLTWQLFPGFLLFCWNGSLFFLCSGHWDCQAPLQTLPARNDAQTSPLPRWIGARCSRPSCGPAGTPTKVGLLAQFPTVKRKVLKTMKNNDFEQSVHPFAQFPTVNVNYWKSRKTTILNNLYIHFSIITHRIKRRINSFCIKFHFTNLIWSSAFR